MHFDVNPLPQIYGIIDRGIRQLLESLFSSAESSLKEDIYIVEKDTRFVIGRVRECTLGWKAIICSQYCNNWFRN